MKGGFIRGELRQIPESRILIGVSQNYCRTQLHFGEGVQNPTHPIGVKSGDLILLLHFRCSSPKLWVIHALKIFGCFL